MSQTNAIAGVPPHFADAVICRIKSAVFKQSSSGNPMIELTSEILKPETFKSPFDGKTYALDSAKLMSWVLLWDLDKKGNPLQTGLTWVNEVLMPRLGLGTINPAAPLYHAEKNPTGVKLEGLVFEAVIRAEERIEQRKLPTGQYEAIKDSKGNAIKSGWQWEPIQVNNILRLAEAETNRAF